MTDLQSLNEALSDRPELVEIELMESQEGGDDYDIAYYRVWWKVPPLEDEDE